MTWRRIVVLLLPVITFVAGLGVGAYWGSQEGARIAGQITGPLASSQAGLYALTQYFVADDRAAEEALREYLAFREDAHSQHTSSSADWSYGFDTTTTLVRLANVRRRSGDGEGARTYFEQALGRCREAGWKEECSEEHLHDVVDHIDRSTLLYQMMHPKEPSEGLPNKGHALDAQEDARK
jgi:hypothetical protein